MPPTAIPEEQEAPTNAADAGESNEENPSTSSPSDDPLEGNDELQQAFHALYLECCQEDREARLIEVKDVKQAENYWAGRQYDWWSAKDQQWKLPTQTPSGFGDLDIEDMPRFQFVTNIYQATGLTVIGAISGAPPRYRFFPEDPDEVKDIETAEGRTKLAKLIERWNPPQKLLQDEAYHAWTGGFIAWWTRYVADGEKYGVDTVAMLNQGAENMESSIRCPSCEWSAPADEAQPPIPCPQCGKALTADNISEEESIPVPEDGDTQDLPKGREVISVYGALNCKRPQHTKEQSQWHYFAIEEEIHYATLRASFPDQEDKLKPGLSFGDGDAFERNARLSVAENTSKSSQSGSSQAALATFARIWFRPTSYWMMKDKGLRQQALELFPRGVFIQFAGSTFCKSEAQSLDDSIVSTHVMPGRGQHRPAIGSSMLSVQDRLNTLSNISMETYEYGIPITYRASDTFNPDADESQRAAPGLEVEVMVQPGTDLRQRILQVRADSTSPDMQKYMQDLFGPVTQYLSGTFPALTGAGKDQPETLGQQSMQHDQAMGRMGVFYVNLKQAKADVLTIACRDFEAHADGEVKIPVFGASGDFESESVDVTALEGEAEAYPEGDESFPELWNQQRATMMQVMDTPYGAELVKEPGNAELFGKMLGITELKIPNLDSWRKQLKEIAEMVKPPAQEEEDGQQSLAGVAPMVAVDPANDDHVTEERCCGWWLNSQVGQRTKRENPQAWEAVSKHRAEHKSALPKPEPETKPLSESMTAAFKDLPPEAQAQVLAQWGIHVQPQDFVHKVLLDKASNTPNPAPGLPADGGPPQAGAPAQPANAIAAG